MKRCSRCDVDKDSTEYYNNVKTADGLHSYCKSCCKEKASQWRQQNPDGPARHWQNFKKNHPNHGSEYHQNNLERDAERIARWTKNNRVRRTLNENKRRAAKRAGGSYTVDEWETLCEQYEWKCLCCGSKPERLSPDHVVPLVKNGTNTIDNIQPLCLKCNLKKHDKIIDYRERM